jgi:hypothetical protein
MSISGFDHPTQSPTTPHIMNNNCISQPVRVVVSWLYSLLLVCLICGFPAGVSAQIASEDFGGTNNSRPDNWTFTNATRDLHWYQQDGYLLSGDSKNLPAPAASYATLDIDELDGNSDYYVETDFWMDAPSGSVMLVARWRNPGTHYALVLTTDGSGNRKISIERRVRGSLTTLSEVDGVILPIESSPPPKAPFRLGLMVQGGNLTAYLNGEQMATAQDNLSLRTGSVGVGQENSKLLFKRFRVYTPSEAPIGASSGGTASAAGVSVPAGKTAYLLTFDNARSGLAPSQYNPGSGEVVAAGARVSRQSFGSTDGPQILRVGDLQGLIDPNGYASTQDNVLLLDGNGKAEGYAVLMPAPLPPGDLTVEAIFYSRNFSGISPGNNFDMQYVVSTEQPGQDAFQGSIRMVGPARSSLNPGSVELVTDIGDEPNQVVASRATIPSNQWVHAAFTLSYNRLSPSSSQVELFIDGQSQGVANYDASIAKLSWGPITAVEGSNNAFAIGYNPAQHLLPNDFRGLNGGILGVAVTAEKLGPGSFKLANATGGASTVAQATPAVPPSDGGGFGSAPAPAPAPVIASTEVPTSYRVVVGEYDNPQRAQSILNVMTTDLGFWNAQSERTGNKTLVFIETSNEVQAGALQQLMANEGGEFAQSKVVPWGVNGAISSGSAPAVALNAGESLPELLTKTSTFQLLTERERQQLSALNTQGDVLGSLGAISQRNDIDPQLQQKLERMAAELQNLQLTLEEQAQQEAKKREQIAVIRKEITKLMNAGNLVEAERQLEQMRAIDPSSSMIAIVESSLRAKRESITEVSRLAGSAKKLSERARTSEKEGDLEDAERAWREVEEFLNTRPELISTELEGEMSEALQRLKNRRLTTTQNIEKEFETISNNIYYIAIALAVAILGGIIYVVTGRRRFRKNMEETLPTMVLPELLDMQGAGLPALESAQPQQLALPGMDESNQQTPLGGTPSPHQSPPPVAPPPQTQDPVSSSAVDTAPPEQPPAGGAGFDPERSKTVAFDTRAMLEEEKRQKEQQKQTEQPIAQPAPAPEPKPAESSQPTGGGLDLGGMDNLFGDLPGDDNAPPVTAQQQKTTEKPLPGDTQAPATEDESPKEGPPAAEEQPVVDATEDQQPADDGYKPDPSSQPDFGEFGLGDSFAFDPEKVKAASSQKKEAPQKDPLAESSGEHPVADVGDVLNINFADNTTEAMPSDWEGEYDFATLKVIDASQLGEGGSQPNKALEYKKDQPSGQVYYSMSFPDVTGEAEVEFDICCLEKNRFLLGVYLEKNKDFRHSIHTVVHCANPTAKASIRLQGTPAPYQLGKWSHVKFFLDMSRHTLRAEVDGEAYIHDEVMDNMPDMINTLAIRDNHPTTGRLLISNIKVKRLS